MLKNLVIAAALCTAAHAQCASLTVTGTGAPGTLLTLAIDGTVANQFAWLIVGQTAGSSSVAAGPFGTINLGLAEPWAPVPVGQTNQNGDASLAVQVPSSVPAIIGLFAQGLTLGFTIGQGPPSLSSCTTNVVGFSIG